MASGIKLLLPAAYTAHLTRVIFHREVDTADDALHTANHSATNKLTMNERTASHCEKKMLCDRVAGSERHTYTEHIQHRRVERKERGLCTRKSLYFSPSLLQTRTVKCCLLFRSSSARSRESYSIARAEFFAGSNPYTYIEIRASRARETMLCSNIVLGNGSKRVNCDVVLLMHRPVFLFLSFCTLVRARVTNYYDDILRRISRVCSRKEKAKKDNSERSVTTKYQRQHINCRAEQNLISRHCATKNQKSLHCI